MNIIETTLKVLGSPFGFLFPQRPQPTTSNYRPQPQQVVRQPPVKQLPASQELNAINAEMGLPVVKVTDAEAALYLPKSRQYLQEYRVKQGEKAVDLQKYNIGQQEIARKDALKLQNEINSYNGEQSRRSNNALQFTLKYNQENSAYITALNQQASTRNNYNVPLPPLKFQ